MLKPRTIWTALLLASSLSAAQLSFASTSQDQLSDCLIKSATASDKSVVLQWTFVALAHHPDLKVYSTVTELQKTQLDQNLAAMLQRILVEQCSTQTKAVIQADGLEAVGESFQQLGRITGEEILKNPEVKSQLKGVLKYIDLNKMVVTFLTPDFFNRLGIIRK